MASFFLLLGLLCPKTGKPQGWPDTSIYFRIPCITLVKHSSPATLFFSPYLSSFSTAPYPQTR